MKSHAVCDNFTWKYHSFSIFCRCFGTEASFDFKRIVRSLKDRDKNQRKLCIQSFSFFHRDLDWHSNFYRHFWINAKNNSKVKLEELWYCKVIVQMQWECTITVGCIIRALFCRHICRLFQMKCSARKCNG